MNFSVTKSKNFKKIKPYKLQTKLFTAYLSLACLILFSFAIFFYFYVSDQILHSQLEAMETLNNTFQTQVDSALKDLDSVSVNINYSNISKTILDEEYGLYISDQMLRDMSDLFITVSGTDLNADQINLFDFSGNILQVGLTTLVSRSPFDNQDLLDEAQALKGSKLITKPYCTDIYSKSAKYDEWFISLYRTFTNQYGKTVGTIETVKRCKSIFKSIISYEKRNKNSDSNVYIFDKNGILIYPYETENLNVGAINQYYHLSPLDTSGVPFRSPLGLGDEYAAKSVSTYSGYTFLTVQPESKILRPVYHLTQVLLAVVGIFLFLSIFICHRLSRSIVKPIKHLKHIIQRLELDTLGMERATTYPVSVNELEELYHAFQNMSDNMKDSMNQLIETQEQEVKSRTMALQSQMNPHFYFNSLSSIIVLAENGDNDVVVKMCRNLSNIMRYITTSSNTIVTLLEELEYTKKYLYCMKVRYQSSLTYDIDIEESLLSEPIPKLMIQPSVENAIKYGSNCPPPWHITIRGRRHADSWTIDVIDSGTGFTEEALQQIESNIKMAQENPGMPDIHINGMGTLNLYLRWKLFCHENMILKYGNTEDGHGIVTIGRYTKEEI